MTDVKMKFVPRDPLQPVKPRVAIGALMFNFFLAYHFVGLVDPIYEYVARNFADNYFGVAFVDFLRENMGMEVVSLKLLIGGLLGYCGFGLLMTIEDLIFINFQLKHHKIQGPKSFFTVNEWLCAVGMSLFNILVMNWPAAFPSIWLWQYLHAGNLYAEDDPWVWQTECPKWIVSALVGETVFYWTHRALHIPILYRNFHKFHHNFTAPIAVATIYTHPVEFIFGNMFAVLGGPVLSNMHPRSAYLWAVYSLIQVLGGHSGYEWHGGVNHDLHHEKFDVNFGSLKLWDNICGTQYHLSDMCKRAEMRKQRSEAERGMSASTLVGGSVDDKKTM